MEFEFDPEKSASNKAKHDLDFIQAQKLWKDTDRIEITKEYRGKPRWAVVGVLRRYDSKVWTAIYAERDGKIRIISVRRAHEDEAKLYWESWRW